MINLEEDYISSLKKKLDNEQFTMTASKKLQEQEFKDLLVNALYWLEKDGKIVDANSPKFDEIVDWVEAMRDITRSMTNDNEI